MQSVNLTVNNAGAYFERKYGVMAGFLLGDIYAFLHRRVRRIITEMNEGRTTHIQTAAQVNAYIAAIYMMGELVQVFFPRTKMAPQKEPKDGKYWGRRMAFRFVENSVQCPPEAIGVVFINAMWYSIFLEEGRVKGGQFWKVVSQSFDAVDALERDFTLNYPKMPCGWYVLW